MRAAGLLAALMLAATPAAAQEPVRLYAAGSLRAVLTEIGSAFTAAGGPSVAATYGPSGLLRERIDKGEPAEVFASANMEHPQMLAKVGKFGPVQRFARNEMCALVNPAVPVESATLLERMLDPAVKLGTSTPKADPSGDYAWEIFRKADGVRAGAFAVLDGKALKLTGGPDSKPTPTERNAYGFLIERRDADIFLTYCTNAVLARKEAPALRQVFLPPALAVGADYGLAVTAGSRAEANNLALFILSPRGQSILAAHGFAAVLPTR